MTIRRQLAQSRPANTSAATLFSQNYDDPVEIETLHICNVTASAVDVSVFHDKDGTTFDQTTAIVYQYNLAANDWMSIDDIIGEWSYLGSIGIQVGTANAATFTLYGTAKSEDLPILQGNKGVS